MLTRPLTRLIAEFGYVAIYAGETIYFANVK